MDLTRKEILQCVCNTVPKLKAAILIILTSGMSIGELVQLRLFDVDFTTTPTKILVRKNFSKGRLSRQTFITEEATQVLQKYLKTDIGWHPNSLNLDLSGTYIFGKLSKQKRDIPRYNSVSSRRDLNSLLKNHIKNIPELNIKNENGRKAIHFHAFRKFFRTNVGNVCGRDYAEALMGHGFYMDTYYQLSPEEKHKKYLSAEPYLTISDYEKVEQQITDLSEKYEDLEKSMTELKQYLVSNSISIPDSLS